MLRDLNFEFTVPSQQCFTFECLLWVQHDRGAAYIPQEGSKLSGGLGGAIFTSLYFVA